MMEVGRGQRNHHAGKEGGGKEQDENSEVGGKAMTVRSTSGMYCPHF